MTLDEAFLTHDDNVRLRRASFGKDFNVEPDILKTYLATGAGAHSVKWLKGLKLWGNQQSIDMGFIIPNFMIEDAAADDWELF